MLTAKEWNAYSFDRDEEVVRELTVRYNHQEQRERISKLSLKATANLLQ